MYNTEGQCARPFDLKVDLTYVKIDCLYGYNYTNEEKYDEKTYINVCYSFIFCL